MRPTGLDWSFRAWMKANSDDIIYLHVSLHVSLQHKIWPKIHQYLSCNNGWVWCCCNVSYLPLAKLFYGFRARWFISYSWQGIGIWIYYCHWWRFDHCNVKHWSGADRNMVSHRIKTQQRISIFVITILSAVLIVKKCSCCENRQEKHEYQMCKYIYIYICINTSGYKKIVKTMVNTSYGDNHLPRASVTSLSWLFVSTLLYLSV